MESDVLKKLHTCELSLTEEVDRICRKHNIKYFLAYGSLIGAIRHHGFIPWDEDMDIWMPREEYEKFLKIAPDELGDRFLLDNYPDNKNYFNPFAKVRLKNSAFEIKALKNYEGHQGIWLDIFPMDYTAKPDSASLNFRYKVIGICRRAICSKRNLYNWSSVGKAKKIILKLTCCLPDKFYWWMMKKAHLAGKKNKNYFIFFGDDYKLIPVPVSDYDEAIEVDFEGKKFMVPSKYDDVLTRIYGDYMQIPPKEKQVTFFPMRVVFEDGQTEEFK